MNRNTLRIAIAGLALTLATPAFAANKDMIQLQTEVQNIQDALARLQQSHDKDIGMLTDLVRQTVDTVNKMSTNVADMQHRMQAVSEAQGGKADQLSGQIQSLNDSIDEIRARLNAIDKNLNNIQGQQQSISASISNMAPAAGGAAPAPGAPMGGGTAAPTPAPGGKTVPQAVVPAAPDAPPVNDLYNTALGDYMAAKYPLASAEFNDVIKFYPDKDLAGNAYYYLGELDYRNKNYASAIKNYDKVLEGYPNNNKIPASHLHKGLSLIALKQTAAGERELQALNQRFPNSPEATQARSRLSAMGVRTR